MKIGIVSFNMPCSLPSYCITSDDTQSSTQVILYWYPLHAIRSVLGVGFSQRSKFLDGLSSCELLDKYSSYVCCKCIHVGTLGRLIGEVDRCIIKLGT